MLQYAPYFCIYIRHSYLNFMKMSTINNYKKKDRCESDAKTVEKYLSSADITIIIPKLFQEKSTVKLNEFINNALYVMPVHENIIDIIKRNNNNELKPIKEDKEMKMNDVEKYYEEYDYECSTSAVYGDNERMPHGFAYIDI